MATVVERTVDIEATTGDVWRVLADDFADAADWNSLMKYSAPNPAAEVPAGSTVGGRVFGARGLGTVTEVITEFDRDTMRLSYRPDKPSAVRDLSNSWSLTEMAPDLAKVTMTARFDMRGFGRLVTPLLKHLLGRSGDTMLTDLRSFVETGQPSPAKRKAAEKLARTISMSTSHEKETHDHDTTTTTPRGREPDPTGPANERNVAAMRVSSAPLVAFGGSVGFTAVMATIGMGLGRQWVQIDSLVWADTWLATFLFLLPCIAVTLTPAAIAVVIALRNAPAGSRERRNWQIAAAGLAVSVLITLVYHLPTNIRIWADDFTADEATTELHRWLWLHAVRTLAGLAAVIASFRAITAARDERSGAAGAASAV